MLRNLILLFSNLNAPEAHNVLKRMNYNLPANNFIKVKQTRLLIRKSKIISFKCNYSEWNESYREIDENLYTADLLQAVLSSSRTNDKTSKAENILLQLRTQLAKVT